MARNEPKQRGEGTEGLASKRWTAGVSLISSAIAAVLGAVGGLLLEYGFEPFGIDLRERVTAWKEEDTPEVNIRAEIMGINSTRAWLPNIDMKPDDLSFTSENSSSNVLKGIDKLGGHIYGTTVVRINVSSSRTSTVRLVDITPDPAPSCFAPAPGSAVVLKPEVDPQRYGSAGPPVSKMTLAVDEPNSQVLGGFLEKDEEGRERTVTRPYFGPDNPKSLTVSKGDSEELQIELSAQRQQCKLSLTMTVEDEDGKQYPYAIPLPGNNKTLVVAPDFDRATPVSGKAYLGAKVCGTVVEVDPAVLEEYANGYDCHKTPPPPTYAGQA